MHNLNYLKKIMQTTPVRSFNYILGLLLCFVPTYLFSEGFLAGTLVSTPNGLHPIETLIPGDIVISRTLLGKTAEAPITLITRSATKDLLELVIDGQSYIVEKNQRFYSEEKRSWCASQRLSAGDTLITVHGHTVRIEKINLYDKEPVEVYVLSVARQHNFCIGKSQLLTHNMSEFSAVAQQGAIVLAAGGGLTLSSPAVAAIGGISLVTFGICLLIEHMREHRHQRCKPHETQNKQNNELNDQKYKITAFGETPSKICDTSKQQELKPLTTNECFPNSHEKLEPRQSCHNPQNQVEKDRSCNPDKNDLELSPKQANPCGYQGQTLPGLKSDDTAKNITKPETKESSEIDPNNQNHALPECESEDEIPKSSTEINIIEDDRAIVDHAASIAQYIEQNSQLDDAVKKQLIELNTQLNPLAKVKYTDKVLNQMLNDDYHSFPLSVDAFGSVGQVSEIVGGDGIIRTKVTINGGFMKKNGFFEYIIESDGFTCNHRLFRSS